ncbi:hypothetical protein ACX9MO_19470 [Pseudooceanicola sp. 502str34]
MGQAVLTGDLVGSSRAGAAATTSAMEVLSRECATMADWAGGDLRFTRFRGDGWQAVVPAPQKALRVTLTLLAWLRASDLPTSRVAIGFGEMQLPATRDLSAAAGPAFEAAGRALDEMGRDTRLACAGPADRALVGALPLADAIVRGWTVKQAEALIHTLPPEPPAQIRIAEALNIRPQSLSERLEAARFWALEASLAVIEKGNGSGHKA